ncbi:dolichyl-P-Man:Man7GlcNAc2-PP-dolichol alpha-1,6-mannosyltransferase [Trifolium repens]|nr:dolichyl-P-Man:Man7GlcNAc2-PP-dolichol alpha-1,6-mannosyltransferase [Trifolium repens]
MPNLVTNYFCIKIVEKSVTEWLKISFFLNKQVTYVTLNNIAFISRMRIKYGFPPILLVKEPKVYVHGNLENNAVVNKIWPGCL